MKYKGYSHMHAGHSWRKEQNNGTNIFKNNIEENFFWINEMPESIELKKNSLNILWNFDGQYSDSKIRKYS